ncbi:hypothetical protein LQ757_18980 [Agromyces sp. SYSU K20354]|uniref:hypothetical protein n=1 Tax=Agromyces cavernae TaxID=2898659 RepID=UPI001E5AFDD1|nr:hypothetical protein [Agromyces cavernae]MCD2444370.1 hypothetical protein [Agromyces cavernae]
MVDENDGLEDAFEGQLRLALTTAAQVGERFAMARDRALDRARRESDREASELRARFDAEQLAARAELANVNRSEWWDRATPQNIGDSYQLANAWAREDTEAQRAKDTITEQVRDRYGVVASELHPDPVALRDAIEEAERLRVQTDAERRRAQEDRAEAVILTAEADLLDRAAEQAREAAEFEPDPFDRADAERMAKEQEDRAEQLRADATPMYDSAERREATARDLETKGLDTETIATRMRADVSQGQPATEATRDTAKRAPKARPSRGRGAGRQQTGLNR